MYNVKYAYIFYIFNKVIILVISKVENEADINKVFILQTIQQKTADPAYQLKNNVST